MATEYQVQTIQESPELEKARLALLKTAEQEVAKTISVPAYEVAGLSAGQIQAKKLAEQGVGAYQPFLTEADKAMAEGQKYAASAAKGIAGIDIRKPLSGAYKAFEAGREVAGDFGALAATAGQGLPMVEYAASMVPGATAAYDPSQALAYMNPYQQQVTQNALKEMQRQADITAQGLAAQAARSGAFGGTREGVQRAETARGLMDIMSQRIFQDYSQNYAQAQQAAQQAFEAQQNRQLTGAQTLGQLSLTPAQIAAQQAGILGTQANIYNQVGQGIGSLGLQQGAFDLQKGAAIGALGAQLGQQGAARAQLGALGQQLAQADIGLLSSIGAQEQALQQSQLDAARATATQEAFLPLQLVSFQSDILSKTPGSQTSIASTTAPTPSPLVQAISAGTAAVTTAAGAKKAGLF